MAATTEELDRNIANKLGIATYRAPTASEEQKDGQNQQQQIQQVQQQQPTVEKPDVPKTGVDKEEKGVIRTD